MKQGPMQLSLVQRQKETMLLIEPIVVPDVVYK
jgi:hypothetical protein